MVLVFTTGGNHTATQVSKTTWETADNAPFTPLAGGFDFATSSSTQSYTIKDSDVGVIYFGCKPHASFGMKGLVNVTGTTAVSDDKFTHLEFNAYPNPTTGIVKFNLSGTVDVEVFNMLGVSVQEASVDNGSADLSHLPQGVYVIRFKKDGNVYVKRIVKK